MTERTPSALERFGLRRLLAGSRPPDPAEGDGAVHVLTEAEQRALAGLERRGILRAALAGALGALAGVVANLNAGSFSEAPVRYGLVVGGVVGSATLAELAFLYFDGVRTVRAMAAAAGLVLTEAETDETIALGLARAALELPSPPDSVLGVHAHQESSKWALALRSLFYKLKVTVTNFLLKTLVRRLLGRAAARVYLEALAIPVAAVWNALVAFWIFREARLRIVGATVADPLLDFIAPTAATAADAALALGAVTVQSESVHPNVEALATALGRRFPDLPRGPDLGARTRLVDRFRGAPREARGVLLRAAVVAVVVDGTMSRREKRLLEALFGEARLGFPEAEIRALAREFRHGAGFVAALFDALGRRLEAASL